MDAIAATTLFSFLEGQCREEKGKKKRVDGWPLTGMEKVQWAHLSVGSWKRESSRMLDLTWPELTMESNH